MGSFGIVLVILLELGVLASLRGRIAHHTLARVAARRLSGVDSDDSIRRCHKSLPARAC